MTALLLCPVALSAQNGVTVSNLSVSDGTVTFDVRWGDQPLPDVWSDSVWVFVDYNAGGVMKRLPLTGATLTNPSWSGASITQPNTQGAWVTGNAKTADLGSFSATVQLLTATADIAGACVYASNYPPVAEYNSAQTIKFTGTPPYDLVLNTGNGTTPAQAYSDYNLLPGQTLELFTDKTGAPGIIKCIAPPTFNLSATASGFCADDATEIAFTLDGTEVGREYRLYRDGTAEVSVITGNGNEMSFGAFAVPGTYTALTIADGLYCPMQMGAALVVAENQLPAPPQLNEPADVCQNDGDIVFIATGYGGTVDWSLSSGGTAEGNSYTFSSASPGTKSVTARSVQTHDNAPTCYSDDVVTRSATVHATPAVPTLTVKNGVADHTPAVFTASYGSGTYDWSGYFSGDGAVKETPLDEGTYSAAVRSLLNFGSLTCASAFTPADTANTLPYDVGSPCQTALDCPLSNNCRCSLCTPPGYFRDCTTHQVFVHLNYGYPCPDGWDRYSCGSKHPLTTPFPWGTMDGGCRNCYPDGTVKEQEPCPAYPPVNGKYCVLCTEPLD
jgi:hypothetical protein